jgi:hypothetical protein
LQEQDIYTNVAILVFHNLQGPGHRRSSESSADNPENTGAAQVDQSTVAQNVPSVFKTHVSAIQYSSHSISPERHDDVGIMLVVSPALHGINVMSLQLFYPSIRCLSSFDVPF